MLFIPENLCTQNSLCELMFECVDKNTNFNNKFYVSVLIK